MLEKWKNLLSVCLKALTRRRGRNIKTFAKLLSLQTNAKNTSNYCKGFTIILRSNKIAKIGVKIRLENEM